MLFYFKISQSSLALEDRSYYNSESDVTIAYRHFIRNLALSMSNTTSTIDDDVNDIFQFEKSISKVILLFDLYNISLIFFYFSIIGHEQNDVIEEMKLFKQQLAIFHIY